MRNNNRERVIFMKKSKKQYKPPYYPYRFEPPELEGTRYLDLCAEFSGQDQAFAGFDAKGEKEPGDK